MHRSAEEYYLTPKRSGSAPTPYVEVGLLGLIPQRVAAEELAGGRVVPARPQVHQPRGHVLPLAGVAEGVGVARWVASLRQVVEAVCHTLSERFGLTFGADLLGTADASGGAERCLQPGRLWQSPVQPPHVYHLQPARILCITRLQVWG